MSLRLFLSSLAVLALCFSATVDAQRVGGVGDRPGLRDQGGMNQGQPPAVYVVVSVDSYAQTLRLRAADGSTADVYVPSGVYDLSKLNSGDKVQVNFLEPDGLNNKLSAANIWPIQ